MLRKFRVQAQPLSLEKPTSINLTCRQQASKTFILMDQQHVKLSSLDLKQRLLMCIKPQAKGFSTNKDQGLVSMVVARSARVEQQLGVR